MNGTSRTTRSNFDQTSDSIQEYELSGGKQMHDYIDHTLDADRGVIATSKRVKDTIAPDLNRNIVQSGIGAFLGAFFAFIFVKSGDWISIKRKGNVNHFNSLIYFGILLGYTYRRH